MSTLESVTSAPIRHRREIYCETCGHEVNATRSTVCATLGHVVSVVLIEIVTFNAPTARPFTAKPAPFLGRSG